MARPALKFNEEVFRSLCGIQCTKQEICDFFRCSPKTLSAWCKREYGKKFEEIYEQLKGTGKTSLRRNQWKLSETNPQMAIWLGKQYLGQRDKPSIQRAVTVGSDGKLEVTTAEDLYGDNDEVDEDG